MTQRQRLIAILALGALAQAAVFLIFSEPPVRPLLGDEVRYHAEARVLLEGGDVPHDFFWPPFHSRFVAGLLGVSGGSLLGVYIVQCALVLLSGLLLRSLLRLAGAGEVAADVATGLFLVDPQLQFFALSLWPETLHLALLLLGTALLVSGRTFGAGAVFGASLLVKSLLLPFLPVLALVAAYAGPRGFREGLRRAALLGLGVLVTAGAVSLRNGLVTGTYGIANSGVFNLWVGLEDPPGTADYDSVAVRELRVYEASADTPAERNAIVLGRVKAKLDGEGLGSVLLAQLRKQPERLLAFDSFFTDSLPGGRMRSGLAAQPLAPVARAWAYCVWGLILVLAAVGLARVVSGGRPALLAAFLPLTFLAYNAGLFLFLHVKTRYRIPILPVLVLFAALALTRRTSSRE